MSIAKSSKQGDQYPPCSFGRKAAERHLVMLLKSLVLSTVDYALPIINIRQNQMSRLEGLQNIELHIFTGCTKPTLVAVLRHLVGVPIILERQK